MDDWKLKAMPVVRLKIPNDRSVNSVYSKCLYNRHPLYIFGYWKAVNIYIEVPYLVPFAAILEKWVPYSQRYLFNAIPDTNHNANPTNPNRYSKGNPNTTNPNTRYRWAPTVVNKAPTSH